MHFEGSEHGSQRLRKTKRPTLAQREGSSGWKPALFFFCIFLGRCKRTSLCVFFFLGHVLKRTEGWASMRFRILEMDATSTIGLTWLRNRVFQRMAGGDIRFEG